MSVYTNYSCRCTHCVSSRGGSGGCCGSGGCVGGGGSGGGGGDDGGGGYGSLSIVYQNANTNMSL